jgi:hypothetical protein
MITSSPSSTVFFDSKYRAVAGTRPGRIFAFLLFRDDFPLTELDLRFEGSFGRLDSEQGSGDGAEGVGGGEGCLELEG